MPAGTEAAPAPASWPPAIRQLPPRRSNGAARVIGRLHFWTGAVLAANFILLSITGLLIQHRERFRLEERYVSRRWLPAGYRPRDPDSQIRADIVVTDLHSGRLFGRAGPVVVDLAGVGFLLMVISGFCMQLVCTFRDRRRNHEA